MIPFEKGEGKASDKPGTWYAWQRHSERPVIDIVCPVCGHCFFLEEGERDIKAGPGRYTSHGVRSFRQASAPGEGDEHQRIRGEVFPSVICPWRCGFHQWIFLQDWTHGELPEVV